MSAIGGWDLAEWFDHTILRHSGIWGAADEAVLNNEHKKINPKNLHLSLLGLYM